jgi:bifunctional enzyme CysN/CysC
MEPLPAPLRVVFVGQVDHGKSTLIGRLLNEAGALPPEHAATLAEMSRQRGIALEWAFVTDALQDERDLGSTIDTSETAFRTKNRSFVVIDAPGQAEFLRNMVTGAASADLAIVVIDATVALNTAALEQSYRQLLFLNLLGIRHLIVAVNKMDLVGYDADRFAATAQAIRDYLQRVDLTATAIIPVAARKGEMIAARTDALSWYHGPTLLEALDRFEPHAATFDLLPLRFSVQDIYRFDERRIVTGRVESGVLRVGDMLTFAPGGATARVASIEDWNQPIRRVAASAGDTIGLTLDPPSIVSRGEIAAAASEPIRLAHRLGVRVFWLAAQSLKTGQSLTLKLNAREYPVVVWKIAGVTDIETATVRPATEVRTNEIADITLSAAGPIPADLYAALPRTGRAVLIEGANAVGGAIITEIEEAPAASVAPMRQRVSRDERERRNHHRGAVLWLTGLPGAGKSTLAAGLERALFDGGMHTIVLDGESIRQGLSRGLGFEPVDRSENIRRVAETAKLLSDAGNIVITALISPMQADRDNARAIIGEGFAEVYIRADLALCIARDPKGYYARARRGDIKHYTGIDAAYETPFAPDLEIDTGKLDIARSIDALIGFVDERFHDPRIDVDLVEPEWSV